MVPLPVRTQGLVKWLLGCRFALSAELFTFKVESSYVIPLGSSTTALRPLGQSPERKADVSDSDLRS